jgi:hypothetical protein
MPPTPEPSSLNTPRLSLQRLGAYNNILTDTLIDGVSYFLIDKPTVHGLWFTLI